MIKRNGDNVFAIASSNNQCQNSRSAVSLCPGSGAATRIPRATTPRMTLPDAHQNTKETNIALSTYVEKWKIKYEESERKHKTYLLKSEKAKREHDDLQRRYNIATEERNHLELELAQRESELNKLRNVSEKLFKEYQQVKAQQEIDSGVMQKVMQQAGEWYKQNKQLKRRSTVLMQALPTRAIEIDLTDSTDTASDASSNEEVEFLKQTVGSLSRQVAELQTELSAVKLQEFEAQEANVALTQELEKERSQNAELSKRVEDLSGTLGRNSRVSKLLVQEVTALKHYADQDRQMAETYKTEARDAKKRVKLLTHQSSLLLGELPPDERLMLLLTEVEGLRGALHSQGERHQEQLADLQLKLAEKHEDTDILLWEEKIKLAEEDAQKALQRAERAEKKLAEAGRSRGLMSRISYFENAGEKRVMEEVEVAEEKEVLKEDVEVGNVEEEKEVKEEVVAPAPPPPPPPLIPPPPPPALPPPPPPPPPPLPTTAPLCQPRGEVQDMAQMLASKQVTLRRNKQNGGAVAIDAIVDQIKGGKFHLRSHNQNFLERKPKEDQPEAVKEMLAILGTLRKRRSVHRPSFVGAQDT